MPPLLQETLPDLADELTVLLRNRNERDLAEQIPTFDLSTGVAVGMTSVQRSTPHPSQKGLMDPATKPTL